jgi:SAM-dependent methyltransferase
MALAQFAREYRTVRRAEGWGSHDAAYYRALPFHDLTGRFPQIWRIRARSYQTFLSHVLQPLESNRTRSLKILDIGAGSGWLANRLALRGHRVIAVDLLDDALDGLGATKHYQAGFDPVLAEYHLPLRCEAIDLAIFNASLHYSTDYTTTLRETLRVLRQQGTLVILDSPTYHDPTSGARMVQERQRRFLATYGFASNALPSEHFLTDARLRELAAELGLAWQVHTPALDWRTALGRAISGLRARREPAHFPVIVGRPSA